MFVPLSQLEQGHSEQASCGKAFAYPCSFTIVRDKSVDLVGTNSSFSLECEYPITEPLQVQTGCAWQAGSALGRHPAGTYSITRWGSSGSRTHRVTVTMKVN